MDTDLTINMLMAALPVCKYYTCSWNMVAKYDNSNGKLMSVKLPLHIHTLTESI